MMKSLVWLVLFCFALASCTTYKPDPERPGTVIKKIPAQWHLEQNGPFYEHIFDQDAGWTEAGYKKPMVCTKEDLDWFDLDEPEKNWKGETEYRRLGCRNKDTTAKYTMQYSNGITQPSIASSLVGPALNGALGFAGMVFLGLSIKSGLQNQPVAAPSPIFPDARFSTGNFFQNPPPGFVLR